MEAREASSYYAQTSIKNTHKQMLLHNKTALASRQKKINNHVMVPMNPTELSLWAIAICSSTISESQNSNVENVWANKILCNLIWLQVTKIWTPFAVFPATKRRRWDGEAQAAFERVQLIKNRKDANINAFVQKEIHMQYAAQLQPHSTMCMSGAPWTGGD